MAEGSQQEEKAGEGEKAEKEDGAVAASPSETGDTNKAKTATCEVCGMHSGYRLMTRVLFMLYYLIESAPFIRSSMRMA